MKPTHYTRTEVAAWQNLLHAPIPVWVARKWHSIGHGGSEGSRCHVNGSVAEPGDWIIDYGNEDEQVAATDAQFRQHFKAI